jgi:protein SCO1/2
MNKGNTVLAITTFAVISVAVAGGFWLASTHSNDTSIDSHSALPNVITNIQADIGGNFELINQDGKKVTYQDFKGKPTLIYFGYTFCPDYCPTTLQTFAQTHKLLQNRGIDTNIVFISVDPDRDTTEVIARYVKLFDSNLQGLTGSKEQIDRAAKSWRVFYNIAKKNEKDTNYFVDHLTYSYLMDKTGKLIAILKDSATAEQISALIEKDAMIR